MNIHIRMISALFCLLTFISSISNATEYIVKFRSQKSAQNFSRQTLAGGEAPVDAIPQVNAVIINGNSKSLAQLKEHYSEIAYVQENKTVHIVETKNLADPKPTGEIASLWGMTAIGLAKAWTYSKGEGVVVAVSDTGVQVGHGDLRASMWNNPGEVGVDANGADKSKNNVDDDGNGFIDDKFGWDYVSNAHAVLDNHYHGTHVAGTIAAAENKSGIAGVAPRAKIMISSFLNSEGSGSEANGAKTIIYAADNGAKIVNCSWGSSGSSKIIADAIRYAQSKGVLIIAASGNESLNADLEPQSPSGEDVGNIISVGATQSKDGSRAFFSNYGLNTVDIAAPGFNIRSTANIFYGLNEIYRVLSGTSMATPHVAGVAALVWSARPDFNWQQVKNVILESAMPAKDWKKKSATGGVLRADKAVELALSK